MTATTLFSPAQQPPRVLTIAGSDPSGGAGIQADIKSISAHGGYAMAAVTALTAQNTQGVQAIHVPPLEFLKAQLDALSDDITIDAVKIGMLGTAEVSHAVGEWLQRTRPPVVVLDPVMVATSGDMLMDFSARNAVLELLEHTHLVTPNLPELAVLLGSPVANNWEEALAQGKELATAYQVLVLVKGGHLPGDSCPDALVAPDGGVQEFPGVRIETDNTHGTGCALSSAVAVLQAQDGDWTRSVRRAKDWLNGALKTAEVLAVGTGAGPINHFNALWEGAAPLDNDFSQGLWEAAAPQRTAILDLEFIGELAKGTLAAERFAYYLAQDALYLGVYAKVLSRASVLAPTLSEQGFWAHSAQNCLEEELSLHQNWLDKHPAEAQLGPVTKHYVDHLQSIAFSGSYGEVVAAVLPCFWIYAEVGQTLHEQYLQSSDRHPYSAWLQSYAAEEFAQATALAVNIMDTAARRGSAAERQRMSQAFNQSVQLELEFFAAPHAHLSAVEPATGD